MPLSARLPAGVSVVEEEEQVRRKIKFECDGERLGLRPDFEWEWKGRSGGAHAPRSVCRAPSRS